MHGFRVTRRCKKLLDFFSNFSFYGEIWLVKILATYFFFFFFGCPTLVGQRRNESLSVSLSVSLSGRLSVIKFFQDWIISFFWYCT